MMYFASKTNNSLNGLEYSPELIPVPICVNPYYAVTVKGDAPFGSIIAVWGTPTIPKLSMVSFGEDMKIKDLTNWM